MGNQLSNDKLQTIELSYIPPVNCISALPKDLKRYVTVDKFCGGYRNGSSVCSGYSGGGLCFESNGNWFLRGIMSVNPFEAGNETDGSCNNNHINLRYNIMLRCWDAEPSNRPSFDELKEMMDELLEVEVKTDHLDFDVHYAGINAAALASGKTDYLTMTPLEYASNMAETTV